MTYDLEIRPRAVRDLKGLSTNVAARVVRKLEDLREGLQGDVKRLTNITPEYRLRVGDYRVLFDVQGNRIIVYGVLHRREAYKR